MKYYVPICPKCKISRVLMLNGECVCTVQKKNKKFWDRVEKNYNKVKKWSKYKQSITISAETANTGQFIKG